MTVYMQTDKTYLIPCSPSPVSRLYELGQVMHSYLPLVFHLEHRPGTADENLGPPKRIVRGSFSTGLGEGVMRESRGWLVPCK